MPILVFTCTVAEFPWIRLGMEVVYTLLCILIGPVVKVHDQGRFEMCEKCMCSTKAGVCSTMVKSVSICQIALTLAHVSDMGKVKITEC